MLGEGGIVSGHSHWGWQVAKAGVGMMNMNLLKIMNQCREFDKDEDGKLSEAELREIMLSLGEEPVTEQEFKHFIKVADTQPYMITTSYCLLTCFEVSTQ